MKVRHKIIHLFEKVKYVFDNVMSKGILPSVILLLLVSFLIVLFFATILVILNIQPAGDTETGFLEAIWVVFGPMMR